MIGTGFHQWVLGNSLLQNHKALWSWGDLVLATASKLGVAVDLIESNDNCALRWEELLIAALEDGVCANALKTSNERPHIANYEEYAKTSAASIILSSYDEYPKFSRRANYPLSGDWGAVISLNFDSLWLNQELPWVSGNRCNGFREVSVSDTTKHSENKRLNEYKTVKLKDANSARVWYPNGHIDHPSTLRLGIREFGFQSIAIYEAFNQLKRYERTCLKSLDGDAGDKECTVWKATVDLLDGVEESHKKNGFGDFPLTWVSEMLYRPVFFAGVGMSDIEVGLWWLMVQRARNLANLPDEVRPPAYILLHKSDKRLHFWKRRPCGIRPIICDDWNEGWENLRSQTTRNVLF